MCARARGRRLGRGGPSADQPTNPLKRSTNPTKQVGPKLLRLVPGKKAADVRTWLEVYSYWNQVGTCVYACVSAVCCCLRMCT